MSRTYKDKNSVMAPAQLQEDITPSASELTNITRFVMVDTDDATLTGYFEGDESTLKTTVPLKAGLIYPFAFTHITAISAGNVKGYS